MVLVVVVIGNMICLTVSFWLSPVTYAWEGGVKFSQSAQFLKACMTREEYEEEGVRGSIERFDV